MSNFNQLTDAQTEALALLSEECGELIQIIGKILRHGAQSCHPLTFEKNTDLLESEIGDVRAAIDIVVGGLLLDRADIDRAKSDKLRRVRKYLHHVVLP